MKITYVTRLLLLLIFLYNCTLFGQSPPNSHELSLLKLMEYIQKNGELHLQNDPDKYWAETRNTVDQQLQLILRASISDNSVDRRLAAQLLSMASPTTEGVDKLIDLASNDIPDVRYAALVGLATLTDGTHVRANKAILDALSETGNAGITRDASLAASHLKIIEALPLIEQLIESEESLYNLYGIKAAGRYGSIALPLLPLLKKKLAVTKDKFFVNILNSSITLIENPEMPNSSSIHNRFNYNTIDSQKKELAEKYITKDITNVKKNNSMHAVLFSFIVIMVITYISYLLKKNQKKYKMDIN